MLVNCYSNQNQHWSAKLAVTSWSLTSFKNMHSAVGLLIQFIQVSQDSLNWCKWPAHHHYALIYSHLATCQKLIYSRESEKVTLQMTPCRTKNLTESKGTSVTFSINHMGSAAANSAVDWFRILLNWRWKKLSNSVSCIILNSRGCSWQL